MSPFAHHRRDVIEAQAEALLGSDSSARSRPAGLQAICRDLGIDLLDADLRDIAGVLRREGGRWKVYLNRDDAPCRRRCTLARLLGHFALHAGTAETFLAGGFATNGPARTSREGREAGALAAALLMPRRAIMDRVTGRRVTGAQVRSLADECGVSPLAIALRLERLGYVVPPPAAP